MSAQIKGQLTALGGKGDGDCNAFAICTKSADGALKWNDFPRPGGFVDAHHSVLAEVSHPGGTFGVKLPHLMSPARELSVFVRTTNLVGLPYSDVQGVFKTCLHAMMTCHVPAVFVPQAWIRDHAVEIDGRAVFNAVPELIKLDFESVSRIVAAGEDLDFLSDGLAARTGHAGPFEVKLDEADLVTMVCLLTNHADCDAMRSGEMFDLTPEMWETFSKRASDVLKSISTPSISAGEVKRPRARP